MIAHAFTPDPFGFRDQCDAKFDEGDGKLRMCGYKRSEHSQPLRSEQECPPPPFAPEEMVAALAGVTGPGCGNIATFRLPDNWHIDAAGGSVRFCRPHETLSFNPQTARALATALVAAADEAEVPHG